MDHYLDIRLRPDPETAPHQVLSALFGKLHLALVRGANTDIGVSFPGVQQVPEAKAPSLGDCLRLHGTHGRLHGLMEGHWLASMRDYVRVSDIVPVPAGAAHRVVIRVQAKSSPERLRRRYQTRHDCDAQEARQRIPDAAAQTLDLPFIALGSSSTAQQFPLFVRHGPLRAEGIAGAFSSYGLSPTTTVPWF